MCHLDLDIRHFAFAHWRKSNIIIASRDDDGGWYDHLQRQNVKLREMMCEMSEEI